MLRRDQSRHHNEGVDDDVKQELDELSAIALRVRKREEANRADKKLIRDKLPTLRARGVGPADLERAIHSVFVQGSISRWTKDHRPGAGAAGQS